MVQLVLFGDTYDDAATAALADAERSGSVLVPPFDDPRTIAGQGTVVREILQQLGRPPDVLVVPTFAAAGVPDRWPVLVLKVAHDGVVLIEKVSVLPSASDAIGWNVADRQSVGR